MVAWGFYLPDNWNCSICVESELVAFAHVVVVVASVRAEAEDHRFSFVLVVFSYRVQGARHREIQKKQMCYQVQGARHR